LDFCESQNLHQLDDFQTCHDVILDLILSEHLNLNTSDHVAVLLRLENLTIPTTTPPDCCVFIGLVPHGIDYFIISAHITGIFLSQ